MPSHDEGPSCATRFDNVGGWTFTTGIEHFWPLRVRTTILPRSSGLGSTTTACLPLYSRLEWRPSIATVSPISSVSALHTAKGLPLAGPDGPEDGITSLLVAPTLVTRVDAQQPRTPPNPCLVVFLRFLDCKKTLHLFSFLGFPLDFHSLSIISISSPKFRL